MLLFLLLLCIIVRFPFYFSSVIDWDESTFILMGQSILDGNLPYVELWDNKPPLAFAFFAPVILFGKSIVAVRIAGTICVFITAYLTYRIGNHIWGWKAGFLAAIFSIIFVSLAESGQATMTEIIAVVPAIGALAVVVTRGSKPSTSFAAGCLLSLATLVRINLAYLALAVGILILCSAKSRGSGSFVRHGVAYALGGLLPLGIVMLPYVATSRGQTFVDAVFVAPLIYSRSLYFPIEVLIIMITGFGLSNILLWFGCLGGVVLIASRWSSFESEQKYRIVSIAVFFTGLAISIIFGGNANYHYLIQLIPFISLVAGYFFNFLLEKTYKIPVIVILLIGLAVPAKPVLDEYVSVGKKLAMNQPLLSDAGYQIASYLKEHNPTREPVYIMTDHIVHWLTGTQPITKSVTHPSTIGKEYLLKVFLGPDVTTESELIGLFRKRPLFVVKTKQTWYLGDKAAKLLEDTLRADYEQVNIIEGRYIYKRVRR